MEDIPMEMVIGQLLGVLREAFEGPPEQWSYFTDNSPDAGLYSTLAKLSSAEASEKVDGTSIAGHVHHVNFALDASTEWLHGDRSPKNWKESWKVGGVNDAEWSILLDKLRSGYKELRSAIESNAAGSVESMGGAIGAIAHVAYHLGAIRQKIKYSGVS